MSAFEIPTPDHGSRQYSVRLYDRNGTVVTDSVIIHGDLRYEVANIRSLGRVTGSLHPGVWAALAVAAGDAVIVGVAAAATQSTMGWVIGAVALVVPCGVAVHYAVRWPREMRLLADYRGTWITVLRTRDKVEFGQVSRAVQRAFELQRRDGF